MTKLLLMLPVILLSCYSKIKTTPPKEGSLQIVAVYQKDGVKQIDILLRKIIKDIKYDSEQGKDIIVIDTIWGYPSKIPLTDSTGKIIKDSLNHIIMSSQVVYKLISKDSINWRIENVPVDELFKK